MALLNMLVYLEDVLLWGVIATLMLVTILNGSQGLGYSRLSLAFIVGTYFSGNRHRAILWGFALYIIGGVVFALLYCWLFANLGSATWWLGALLGLLHALFLLVVVFPLLPHMHPRMASEYGGPSASRRLEPPGFLGLNYGYGTPITTILGHVVYVAMLGGFYALSG